MIKKGRYHSENLFCDSNIYLNGMMLGTTPVQLNFPPKNTYYLEFRKPGFENKNYMLFGNVGGGYVLLDVIFGLVQIIIDAATGSWHIYPML